LTKLVNENKTNWDEHLPIILFSYKTTYKVITWYTTFQLVYGLHPIECVLPIIGSEHRKGSPMRVLTSMVSKLEKLLEDRLQSKVKLGTHQWNRALWSQ
jgi:hypothetical protein